MQQTMCCGACGVEYSMPKALYDECVSEGPKKTFYCPNGHPRIFVEGTEEKMRRERDRAIQQQEMYRQQAVDAMERANKAEKEKLRLKKRAAAGVCPCCNRTFSNMAAHMKTKHPDMTTAEILPLKKGKRK